jgi:photosystem II stability/assembly factor-like uncharacterized protein
MNAAAINRMLAVCGLLLVVFCFPPTAFCSSWTRQPSGTMAWLHSVYFLDQNHGWIAGGNGTLLSTVDGGVTWNKNSSISKDTLTDVYFSDSTQGWVLAQRDIFKLKANERGSYLLNTNDGGNTWRRIFLDTPDVNTRFTHLVFSDPQHGWVFGETGTVFATTDAGAHWLPQHSPSKHLLLGGAFANDNRGLIVGAATTIMQSDDGVRWRLNASGKDEHDRLNAVAIAGRLMWAAGNNGRIITSLNGGHSWIRQNSETDADLFDIKFIDAREGWAVGAQGVLLHTNDGGLHWRAEPVAGSRGLERLFILDRNHVWAVGFGGTILRFGETNAPRLK